MLSEHCNEKPATAFFKQATTPTGSHRRLSCIKLVQNYVGIENINSMLMLSGLISFIDPG
jgi:hypothetical protein